MMSQIRFKMLNSVNIEQKYFVHSKWPKVYENCGCLKTAYLQLPFKLSVKQDKEAAHEEMKVENEATQQTPDTNGEFKKKTTTTKIKQNHSVLTQLEGGMGIESWFPVVQFPGIVSLPAHQSHLSVLLLSMRSADITLCIVWKVWDPLLLEFIQIVGFVFQSPPCYNDTHSHWYFDTPAISYTKSLFHTNTFILWKTG